MVREACTITVGTLAQSLTLVPFTDRQMAEKRPHLHIRVASWAFDLYCNEAKSAPAPTTSQPRPLLRRRFDKTGHRNLAGKLTLCLLSSVPSLAAQGPPAPKPPIHLAQPRGATPGKKSASTVVPAASAILFENTIQQSKIKFKLKNSVSPQRYTFETMTGGVAVFDY